MKLNSFPLSVPLAQRLSFCAFRADRLLKGECAASQQAEFDALALVPVEKTEHPRSDRAIAHK